jgi:hypothetical protein
MSCHAINYGSETTNLGGFMNKVKAIIAGVAIVGLLSFGFVDTSFAGRGGQNGGHGHGGGSNGHGHGGHNGHGNGHGECGGMGDGPGPSPGPSPGAGSVGPSGSNDGVGLSGGDVPNMYKNYCAEEIYINGKLQANIRCDMD